jgi:hypothetical protein
MFYVSINFRGNPMGCFALEDPETLVSLLDAAHDNGLTLKKITQEEFDTFDEGECLPLNEYLETYFETPDTSLN